MQDRYVADVGDFGKYGLLRTLSQADIAPPLSLGVVWYLTEPTRQEVARNDGRHVGYLGTERLQTNRKRFWSCAPELYEELAVIAGRRGADARRNLAAVQDREGAILPQGTRYYPDPVPSGERQGWLEGALQKVKGCDLVFLDPDNGLKADRDEPKGHLSPKHAYCSEVARFLDLSCERSLVIYHHTCRKGKVPAQIRAQVAALRGLCAAREVKALWYHRGSARIFFVIAAAAHAEVLSRRIGRMVSDWGKGANPHFELWPE